MASSSVTGARVCLVTTGQPSTNPRLVKEADALVEAGYRVRVIGAHWADWAVPFDEELRGSRGWQVTLVDWRRSTAPRLFWKTRIRYRAARALVEVPATAWTCWRAGVSRLTPELIRASSREQADLFIAHNLGALPAALAGAARTGAAVGFDAEDFHSGEAAAASEVRRRRFIERVERRLLPACSYVTAASPLIAEAYRQLTGIAAPTCILNVFPLQDRPASPPSARPDRPLRLYWFSQTIGARRGLEDAVQAIGYLKQYPIELHIRGAWQPGYRSELLAFADRAGVSADRIVCHDPAPPDQMVKLAADCDVGLAVEQATSVNNDIALSNKIFTYLLAGTAVVATSTRAQSAVAADLDGAIALYPCGDSQGLVSALRRWLENPAALFASRRIAWQLGTSRYNWDVEKHTFLRVVAEVLAERSRARALLRQHVAATVA